MIERLSNVIFIVFSILSACMLLRIVAPLLLPDLFVSAAPEENVILFIVSAMLYVSGWIIRFMLSGDK